MLNGTTLWDTHLIGAWGEMPSEAHQESASASPSPSPSQNITSHFLPSTCGRQVKWLQPGNLSLTTQQNRRKKKSCRSVTELGIGVIQMNGGNSQFSARCVPTCPLLSCAKSLQSCPTLCDPVDQSPPGSSVHGFLQARRLEEAAVPSCRGSSQPRDKTLVS